MVNRRALAFGVVLLGWVAWSAPARLSAASVARQIEQIFEPERVVGAALAPDGRHVAFAMRDARGVELIIWNVASSERPGRARLDPRAGAALTFLGWSSARRLIAVPDAPLVVAVDLRGRTARPVVDEKAIAAVAGGRRPGHAALRVLRLQRDRGILTLEVRWSAGGGGEVLDVVAVNLESGEHQLVHTRRGNGPGGLFLADREGRPRLWFNRGAESSRYLYLPPDGERRDWQPLDRMIGARGEDWFAITPEIPRGARDPAGIRRGSQPIVHRQQCGRGKVWARGRRPRHRHPRGA
jgi:hypothetical protein